MGVTEIQETWSKKTIFNSSIDTTYLAIFKVVINIPRFYLFLFHLRTLFSLHWNEILLLQIEHEEFIEPKFISAFFMAFGAACQQGTNTMPHTISGRIITIILFTSLMFLYASYSANIVALLQSSSTSIQTLSDLLHSRLQVGVDDTVFNRFYFPVRKYVYAATYIHT